MIIAIYLKGTDRPLPMQEKSVAAASLAVYRYFTAELSGDRAGC